MSPEEFSQGEREWQAELARSLDCPVRIVWTRARTRVIASRRMRAGELELRMAGFFASAPPEVRVATASWLRSGRRAKQAVRTLDAFIASSLESLPPKPPRALALRTRGSAHDLEELLREVLARDFAHSALHSAPPAISWGRAGGRGARRVLRLGSCVARERLIRIHPVLDQPAVPRFFVRFIVFHELLHLELPSRRGRGGRAVHHGADFRARERSHPDHERALAWERQHIEELLLSARSRRPMRAPRSAPRARPVLASVGRLLQGLLFDP